MGYRRDDYGSGFGFSYDPHSQWDGPLPTRGVFREPGRGRRFYPDDDFIGFNNPNTWTGSGGRGWFNEGRTPFGPVNQFGSFAPNNQFGSFVPQFGSFVPQFGSFAPQFGSFAPQFGSFAPQFGSFAPQFGSFAPFVPNNQFGPFASNTQFDSFAPNAQFG